MTKEMAVLWSLMSVYVIFGLQSGFMTAFLNSMEIFALPAVGPLIINLIVIGAIMLAKGGEVKIISLALVFGSLVQMLWLMFLSLRNGISFAYFKELFSPLSCISKSFLKAVLPVAAWIFLLPFIPVYERYLLSMQSVGSVSTLDYVIKIFNLPLGIISISAARVIFPFISRLKGEVKLKFLYKALISVSLILIPVILAMVIGSEKIVEIVLKRGKFNLEDTILAGKLLKSYIPALLPLTLSLILNRYCFSEKDFKTPFFAGLIAIGSQFFCGSRFVAQFGSIGIGYAAVVAYSAQMFSILVIRGIKKSLPKKLSGRDF
jgi:putative peptidoglycan lipid II flippase